MNNLLKQLGFCALFLLCASCLTAQTSKNKGALTSKESEAFKKEILNNFNILQLPGLSVAVVKDGTVVYRQIEGLADLEKKIPLREKHMFQIASVTKTFTANLMMQYEQERIASVEDYALNYRFINTWFGWPYNVDANSKIKHFLNHTSEDGPGNSFVYNGQRFNYIYGVFEKAGGHAPNTDGYSKELQKRIFDPLRLTGTIAGFPDNRTDTLFESIAKPYIFDSSKQTFVEDTVNYRWTDAYPATGIMSTVDDLARYTTSYDRNELITAENYQKVTTPQRLNDGSASPYGIGWFTEEFAGYTVHWHYGHADSYASLLIRVPQTGYTFILLANSNAPSDALRLGSGQIWQSPFFTAFFKHFILKKPTVDLGRGIDEISASVAKLSTKDYPLVTEELAGQALFRRYAEKTFGTRHGEAKRMVELIYKINPARFEHYDPSLVYLLTDLNEQSLYEPLSKLITAYKEYGHIQPYVLTDIAGYYDKIGNRDEALYFYQQLADSKGFETWWLTIEACKKAGLYLSEKQKHNESRDYYWKAVNYMKSLGFDDNALTEVIEEMNKENL